MIIEVYKKSTDEHWSNFFNIINITVNGDIYCMLDENNKIHTLDAKMFDLRVTY